MTGVIAATWIAVGQGGSSAGASRPSGLALPLRTATPTPTPTTTELDAADGVPVLVEQAVAAAGRHAERRRLRLRVGAHLDLPRRRRPDRGVRVEAAAARRAELSRVGAATPNPTVQTLLAAMIENSDNDAADDIFERVGQSGVAAFDRAVGASSIVPTADAEFGLDTTHGRPTR